MAVTGHVGTLTEEQRRQADEDGYFVVEGIVPPQECRAFIDRLSEYAHERRPLPPGLAIQREPRIARGELGAPTGEDVRKISGVAKGDDLFRALVMRPAVAQRMRDLMGPDLELFRADVLMKPAGVGSAKGMHQDSPYWPIEPMALWSCWLPFDPATLENGCMTAIPGSHKRGALPHVHVTDDYVVPEEHCDQQAAVPIPMAPGSGLFFHSLLLHGTAENRSPMPRRAITMSYMAADYRYTGKPPRPDYLRVDGAGQAGEASGRRRGGGRGPEVRRVGGIQAHAQAPPSGPIGGGHVEFGAARSTHVVSRRRWPATGSAAHQPRQWRYDMGNIVVSQFVTLDGVFEDPGGSKEFDRGGWAFRFNRGPEGDRFKLDELTAAGALLLGRVTYEGFAKAWPSIKDEVGFAERMNGMPKYVISATLERAAWANSTIIRGDVPDAARRLKREVDGDILVNGSGQLVRALMAHDLVDEYRLMVYPVVLGGGKRLFGESAGAKALRLVESRTAGDTLILIYRPAETGAAGA